MNIPKNIIMKFGIGVLYIVLIFIIRFIVSLFLGGILSLVPTVGDIVNDVISYAVVAFVAFKARIRRDDLKKPYLENLNSVANSNSTIFGLIPLNEFMFELIAVAAYLAVKYLLVRENGCVSFIIFMIILVVANAAIWVAVHRSWEEE